ncbi:Fic family protein [Mesorhizobium sp. RIZ17]|uniref:Fic family protein n=1 Tax=Mesorhizobium sp. RIZ17 TaxID=3132743 RepID=UPI003DA7BFDA
MPCLATPSESCFWNCVRSSPAQNLDAVVAAAIFAFGFVYIHPFEDGNGRIHRYLIHHVLAMHRFNRREWCFPSRPRSWTRSTSTGACWRAI